MEAGFRLDTSDPRFAVAHLSGRLDVTGTGAVELPMAEAVTAHDKLAVDLSQVDYISSVGLRLLMRSARSIGKRGGQLVIVNPHPNSAQILRLAGLEKLFRISPDGGTAAAFET